MVPSGLMKCIRRIRIMSNSVACPDAPFPRPPTMRPTGIAEFLRRIPEAAKKKVLVVGMTNRIEMIDPAILRRGRFDHVVKVDMASESEIDALLQKLLSRLPQDSDIDVKPLAQKLQGRPLSDVAFIVREGARLAARSSQDKINQACLLAALAASPSREEIDPPQKIGFAT